MSRLGQVLRFTPAALLVLLAFLWLASLFSPVGFSNQRWALFALQGRATWQLVEGTPVRGQPQWRTRSIVNSWRASFGEFGHRKYTVVAGNLPPYTYDDYDVPVSFLMLLLLPVAVGCLTRFQFRLWMYFVGVALVAVCVLNWRF